MVDRAGCRVASVPGLLLIGLTGHDFHERGLSFISALLRREGVRFVGRIEKRDGSGAFLKFLRECDLGCLFSNNEALGISTLEFLRAGVPVAGFAHQGLADTLPPDAGFRFPLHTSVSAVADELEIYLHDETRCTREAYIGPIGPYGRTVRRGPGWRNKGKRRNSGSGCERIGG